MSHTNTGFQQKVPGTDTIARAKFLSEHLFIKVGPQLHESLPQEVKDALQRF